MPQFYQTFLQSQFSPRQFLLLHALLLLVTQYRTLQIERLAQHLCLPGLAESRRRALQRFLLLPQLTMDKLWFPLVRQIFDNFFPTDRTLYLAMDRTDWRLNNLLVISLVWQQHALPLYFIFMPTLGSSFLAQQQEVIQAIQPLIKGYQVILLADREFCSVQLGNWLGEQGLGFCLRLKSNTYTQKGKEQAVALNKLGIKPGTSLFLNGVKVTKRKGFGEFNVACKWKRKYRKEVSGEGWYILTSLDNLNEAIVAYQCRWGIEAMFKDCKSGGYNLEDCRACQTRLRSLIILMMIAYSSCVIQGLVVKDRGLQKYLCRPKESAQKDRRNSTFKVGMQQQVWIGNLHLLLDIAKEMVRLAPRGSRYLQQALRAMERLEQAS
jgi:hypothetical protein